MCLRVTRKILVYVKLSTGVRFGYENNLFIMKNKICVNCIEIIRASRAVNTHSEMR